MELAIDKHVEACHEKVLQYNNAVAAEQQRIDQLIGRVHEFISSSAEFEVIMNYESKKKEVETDNERRCGPLMLNPLQRLSVEAGIKHDRHILFSLDSLITKCLEALVSYLSQGATHFQGVK